MITRELLSELCLDIDRIALARNWGVDRSTLAFSSIDMCLIINREGFTRYEKAINKLNQTTFGDIPQISWFKERLFTDESIIKMDTDVVNDLYRQCTDDMLIVAIRVCLDKDYTKYQGIKVRITSGGKQNSNYTL